MAFTVKTLERCLRQEIQLKTLFDYLDNVVRHGSQQQSIDDFNRKLNGLVNSCIQKMQIVDFSGLWLPQCSVTSKLRCQKPWTEFVSKFVPGFSPSRMVDCESNPKFQPLNFKELVYLTFWQELYETYGEPTVTYLFEKCAFLFEVEEGLHLLVAYHKCPIFQRMLKYECLTKTLTGLPSNGNGAQRSKSENPYQLAMPSPQPILEAAVSAEQQQTDNSEEQKDSTSGTESDKMHTSQEDNMNQIIGEGEIERPGEPRWLKPKPEELKKIIDLRNKMLSLSQPSAALSSLTPSLPHVLNFVLVKPDPEIKSTNKRLILKQKVTISTDRPKPKLPRDWTGLRLPDNLAEVANERKEVQIHVYIISETLTRELGLRVKPKGRAKRNRRGKAQNPPDSDSPDPPSAGEEGQKVIPQEQPGTVTGNDVELRKLTDPVEKHRFSSFSPMVTLPIGPFLYNKTTSTKWPESHSLRRAAAVAPADTVAALKRVVKDILGVAISSEPAYEYFMNVIDKNWTNLHDESFALNTIIWNIIKRHGKFGNTQMHRLLKSCLQYWRGKHLEKQSRMQSKRETKQKNNLNGDIVTGEGNGQCPTPNAKCSSNPSVIDLTQTTSSTGTTHFSGPFPNQTPTPELIDLSMEMEVDEIPSGLSSLQQNASGNCATATTSNPLSDPNNPRKGKNKRVIVRKDSGQSGQPKKFKSLKDAVPYNCVMQALKQIFHMMKLDELLGSKRNVRGFFKFVRKALVLGGARSSLHLSQLMALIRPEETPLAQACGYDRCATETLTAKVVTWLFNHYVLVLLHTSFYITECSFTRFHVSFYLRESWTGAAYKMQQSLIKKGALKLDTLSSQSQPSVNAVLRYVPKSNLSLRSLLVMKRTVTSSGFTRSGQPDIKTLKLFLHYVDAKVNQSRPRLPTVLQVEWRNFISQYKANGWPKLYFLRMDIQDAYPGVSLPKLVDILVNINNEAGHQLVQKQYLVFNGAGRKVVRGSFFDDRNRKNWHSGIHIRPAILMDLDRDRPVHVAPILNEMTKLLTTSRVVKIGKRLYEFNYGLPQGWNLSPILCSIYYGYIDATLYIPFVSTPGRLFLRLVDDYLFISPEAKDILNLMQLMKIGCEKYGIKLNEEKSETNIFVRSDVEILESDSHCEKITFCGWNFCLSCGHVSRDYAKYHGQDFSSTISFQMPNNVYSPEQFIRLRATLIMAARLKPILMDPSINCFKRILLTTFEASIILGFRFYAICRVVYPSLNAVKEDGRAEVLFSSIRLCCCRLANFILRHSKQGSGASNSGLCCNENCCGVASTSTDAVDLSINFVSYHSLLWVAFNGFRLKLMAHSTPFRKHLIPKIDAFIRTLGKKLGPVYCKTVFTLLGKGMPTEIKKIRI